MSRSKQSFDILMQLWPMGKFVNRLGNWPAIGPLLRPCFGAEGNEAIIVPVQEAVQGIESVILPYHLHTPLIEQCTDIGATSPRQPRVSLPQDPGGQP